MADVHLLTPRGFKAAGVYAGIKSRKKPDVGLLVCDHPSTAAAVFTTCKVASPSVILARENVRGGILRGAVVNAGVSNACTGKRGAKDALEMCRLTAAALGGNASDYLPASTGVIGHFLPMEKISRGIKQAAAQLAPSASHAKQFAAAILTTDLRPKAAGVQLSIGGQRISIAGVCKGSGMIGPRMTLTGKPLHSTMLAYLTTDAKIAAPLLRRLFAEATDVSFNAVTVDDQTSTSDTALILASGLGGVVDSMASIASFSKALREVCQSLAQQIAADGEGATKLVRIDVSGARTEADAKLIARSIANSPLVKCAMNGNDPNWGRIVQAAGSTPADFNGDKSTVTLQGTRVYHCGMPVKFDASLISKSLDATHVLVEVKCGLGKGSATIWTCDLSRRYVTINADYHT